MSIRALIDDAIFLAERGRYVGALTVVLAAVSGTSRKVFPRGTTPSVVDPKDKRGMGDKEAFTRFLGRRICEEAGMHFSSPDATGTFIAVELDGKPQPIELILYERFRCSLSHEGRLPATVDFNESRGFNVEEKSFEFGVENGVVRLEHGWLSLLVRTVMQARCNGPEFGLEHYELRARAGVDADGLAQQLITDFDITEGRVEILKRFVEMFGPEQVLAASRENLNAWLAEMVARLGGGCRTGLVMRGLATWTSEWTEKGLAALARLAPAYERVRVI